MTATRTLIAAVTLSLGLISTASTAQAQHIHDLAQSLEGMSRQMISEFRVHYHYLPEYRHLMHDAAEVAQLAHHIHDLTDEGEGLDHIHDDLHELDDLYHHLDDTLRRVESRRACRHGTRHVRGLMNVFHDTLEHMLEDVEEAVDGGSPQFDNDAGFNGGYAPQGGRQAGYPPRGGQNGYQFGFGFGR